MSCNSKFSDFLLLQREHVLVMQDFLTKWPLVFAMPDQKTMRIVRLLVKQVIPLFGVLEALLSNRGTNLLSHLMLSLESRNLILPHTIPNVMALLNISTEP